jgi:hypothetical protein
VGWMITVERGTVVDGIPTTVLTRSHMTSPHHYLEIASHDRSTHDRYKRAIGYAIGQDECGLALIVFSVTHAMTQQHFIPV